MVGAEQRTATGDLATGAGGPRKGVYPPSTPGGRHTFLSDVIVELGFADRDTVEQAVEAARVPGRTLQQILLEQGTITEEQLARAIGERYGLDYIDLDEFEVDLGAANLISTSTALRYHAVPVAFDPDGTLVVAMTDPADTLAIDDIAVMTKLEVRPAVATRSGIEALIERLPRAGEQERPANTLESPAPTPQIGSRHGAVPTRPAATTPPVAPSTAPPSPAPVDDAQLAELRAELERLQEELQEARSEAERTRGELEQARSEAEEANAELERLREESGRAGAERERLAELEARGGELAVELERMRGELERTRGELEIARAELETKRAEGDRLRAEMDRLREEAGAARGEAEAAQAEIATLRARVAELEGLAARSEGLETDLQQLRAENERLRGEIEALREGRDQELEQARAELERAREEADRRALGAERALEQARKRLLELEEADQRAERARATLAKMREEFEREREHQARTERYLRATVASERARREALEALLDRVRSAGAELQAVLDALARLPDPTSDSSERASGSAEPGGLPAGAPAQAADRESAGGESAGEGGKAPPIWR